MEKSRPCREAGDKARKFASRMKSPTAEEAGIKSELDGLELISGAYRRVTRRSRSCRNRSRSVILRRYLNASQRRELTRSAPVSDRNNTCQMEAQNAGHGGALARGWTWRNPYSGRCPSACHPSHGQQRLFPHSAYHLEASQHELSSYSGVPAAVIVQVPLTYVLMPWETLKQKSLLPPRYMDDSCFQ